MDFSDTELLAGIKAGDFRAVSRLISLVENRSPRARDLQAALFRECSNTITTHVIGVTGAPGAGKSTLVDQLAANLRVQGKRVAIVAVDPTSPFTGGAILGDRIRMVKTSEDAHVFIRSMATRGALGGVSRATIDAVQILGAAGFDAVFVETVGVGQAEVDIVRLADTCMVVLVPGMGDSVQAMKAGILEIADVYVINKADRDGSDLVYRDLKLLLSVSNYPEGSWTPPIVKTVAINGEGTDQLLRESSEHRAWLGSSTLGRERRLRIMRDTILKRSAEDLRERIAEQHEALLSQLANDCFEKRLGIYEAVEQLIETLGVKAK